MWWFENAATGRKDAFAFDAIIAVGEGAPGDETVARARAGRHARWSLSASATCASRRLQSPEARAYG